MIYKQCILTINGNNAKLDEDIYLFRLDKNIELYFTIVNNKYKFNKSDLNNIINLTNASYFQMRLYKNAEVKYTFAIQPTDNEKAILTITDDLIDEPIEVGDYDFQISLLDADKSSMISLPIVSKQIHVCEPLVTDASETGTAVLGLSTLESGEIVDAFDEEGNYIRKVHVNGELISAELFNKWEEALETNSSNIKTLDSQFKDIANKFTTEQTDNNFILKYGDKIIATIPINGTLVNYGSIVISCNEILEINEGETLDIEVYLSSKPTNNQSIVITTSNSNITTSVSELTFTPNNYATSQIITLTAIHDVSSFDDKNCLVTFASENVENITITVTIKNTDVQQSHYITDGLSLYYDFTETPTNPTTVYDKVNNVSIYNKNYTADNYTSNGVYLINGGGAEAYKFGSSSVSVFEYQTMPEFNNFLNKIKEGNGLTIEYFGQYIPVSIMYAYNSGVNASGTGAIGGGYLTKYESLGGVTFKYLNTSNETTSVSLAQSDKATKDGQSIVAYSADNKADTYIHLVITADETGKLTWYLNGNVMSNTATATDFASWDYDTMFKANYCMLVRCGVEDTNRLIYPATSIKIYNRALIQDEIKTNLEYEISKTNFVNSASVTP